LKKKQKKKDTVSRLFGEESFALARIADRKQVGRNSEAYSAVRFHPAQYALRLLRPTALAFLYKQVLDREDLALENIAPAKRPQRLPTVFDRNEIEQLFDNLDGTSKLVAALLYGSGLRLLEALRLRIQDIELERSQIVVRNGKESGKVRSRGRVLCRALWLEA